MNDIVTIASTGVAATANSSLSVSRGVLALQGTGLSAVGIFGAAAPAPLYAVKTDKPEWGWHDFAHAADHKDGMPAIRLRRTNPATVIRSRHRSRLR